MVDMYIQTAKKVLPVLIVLALLGACGDLDFMLPSFPSNDAYQIRATINGDFIENCSLIWGGDQISPYFAGFIADDPDLTGMAVFLEDAFGMVAGGTVKYLLNDYIDDYVLMEYEVWIEAEEIVSGKEQTEAGGADRTDDELPADSASDEYMFQTPEPAKEYNDTLIIVKRLDRIMPNFTIPANLKIGEYTLVFQALGRNDILYRSETSVFYLGNAELSLQDIRLYFPGASSGSRLIPPETTLMLEACLDFDRRLDPYIVWYYGRDRISEGKLSDGAGTILWKAPRQTGFHSVRAEVLPFQLTQRGISGIFRDVSVPVSAKAANIGYFFNDIPPVVKAPHELVLQYLFGGSLEDSGAVMPGEQPLIPAGNQMPQWTPLGYSYGLAAGPEDEYMLPPVSFLREEAETGGGQLLLHFIPVADGSIVSVVFPSRTGSGEDTEMHLFLKEENTFVLRLSAPGAAPVETSLPVTAPEADSYTAAVIDFFIQPDLFEAEFSLGQDMVKYSETLSVHLPNPLSGEGRIRLGGSYMAETAIPAIFEQPEEESEIFEPIDLWSADTMTAGGAAGMEDIPEKTTTMTGIIWDELTILYVPPPVADDPVEEEDDEILPVEEETKEEIEITDNEPAIAAEPQSVLDEATAPLAADNKETNIIEEPAEDTTDETAAENTEPAASSSNPAAEEAEIPEKQVEVTPSPAPERSI